MSNMGDVIREWSEWVMATDEIWDNPRTYFRSLCGSPKGWRPAVICIAELSKRVRTEQQAANVSLLLEEFLPINTPPKIVKTLRKFEWQMYNKLRSPWGILKCKAYEASQLPEGRKYLKALSIQPKK